MTVVVASFLIALGGLCAPAVAVQESGDLREALQELEGLVAKGLPDRAPQWRCDASTKFQCSVNGCSEIRPTVWVNLDFPARRLERCDAKGCDRYEMVHSISGLYTTITLVGHPGTFLKAVNDGSQFVEVASILTRVFTSFGRCLPR